MENYTKIIIDNLKETIKNDILFYNDKATNYNFEFEIKNDFVFIIAYSTVKMQKYQCAIYRMKVVSIYGEKIFNCGNVIDLKSMYTINDVIKKAQNYYNIYAKELNNINL